MHTLSRLFPRLLSLAVVLLLSGCAELALTEQPAYTTQPANAAQSDNVDVVINIAPTPLPTPAATAIPAPVNDPACTDKAGQLQDGYFPSKVIGRPTYYRIYLPPCYGFAGNVERYPVIYLFHGSPLDERHWIDVGVIDAADKLIGSGQLPPFIIVLPRGDLEGTFGNSSGGDNSGERGIINELSHDNEATYRTLAERQYRAIGGLSRGGVWSLESAFRQPDLFQSAGGHSPALSANLAPDVYDPLVIARDAPIDSLRVYLDSGDNDWTRFSTEQLSKILDARHIAHTFSINPGVHENSYWSTQVEAYLKFYAAPWEVEQRVKAQLRP